MEKIEERLDMVNKILNENYGKGDSDYEFNRSLRSSDWYMEHPKSSMCMDMYLWNKANEYVLKNEVGVFDDIIKESMIVSNNYITELMEDLSGYVIKETKEGDEVINDKGVVYGVCDMDNKIPYSIEEYSNFSNVIKDEDRELLEYIFVKHVIREYKKKIPLI